MNLSLQQQGVYDIANIANDGHVDEGNLPGVRIHFHFSDLASIGKIASARVEGPSSIQAHSQMRRPHHRRVGHLGNFNDIDAFVGARDRKRTILKFDVRLAGFQQVARYLFAFLNNLICGKTQS